MASRSLGTLSLDLVMQMGGFEQGMDKAQRATDKFSKGIKKQQNDLDRLIGKIDPVVGRLSELDRMEEKLRKHHKDGLLPKDDFDHYLKKVTELRDATGVTSDGFKNAGMSARQLAAATRGLPAQFTDIAVSLQGGQKPLTVLMQQGGQLKDMFGGIGPAAKAMGGYIAGLINPYTLLAGAVGGIAYAAYSGSTELSGLNKVLIQTGRNVVALDAAASSVRSGSGATGSSVASAMQEIAKNGNIASSQIEGLTRTAVTLNEKAGQSFTDTAAQLGKIADDPTKAMEEYARQAGAVSAAVVDQIRKLQENGKAAEAVKLAFDEWQRTSQETAEKVRGNLSWMEQGVHALSKALGHAWDQFENLGRVSSVSEELATVNRSLEQARRSSGYGWFEGSDAGFASAETHVKSLLEKQAKLTKQMNDQREVASKDEAARSTNNARLTWDAESSKYYSEAEKHEKEIAKIRAEGAAAGISSQDIEKRVAAAKAAWDKKKPAAYHNDAGTSRMQSLRETEASLRAQLGTVSKLTSAEQDLVRFNQQIADLKNKKQLTAEEKSLKNNEGQLRQQYEINAELARQVKHQQDIVNFQQKASQLRDTMSTALENQGQQQADSLAGFGLGDRARAQIKEQQAVDREYARYHQQAMKSIPQGMENSEEAKGLLSDVDKQKQAQIDAMKAGWDAEAKARGDWQNGMTQAWGNYLDKAQDVASSTRSVFEAAFGGMEDSLVTFVKTGKLSFSSLVDSIVDGLARIAVQQAVLGLAGMLGGAFAGGAAASTSTGASSGINLPGASSFQFHAAGGYISGPGTSTSDSIPAMLSDGEFVVNAAAVEQPGVRDMLEMVNARKYAAGGYVASSGYAGSTAAGAFAPQRQGGVVIENITVEVTAQQGMSDQEAQNQGQQIAVGMMTKIAQDVVASETMRTNGVIFNAISQR